MAMDYKAVADQVKEGIGGLENVQKVNYCATRLRFTLKDETKVDDDAVKAIKGVVTTVPNGKSYQVVVGTEVAHVYEALGVSDTAGEGETNPIIPPGTHGFWPILKAIVSRGLDVLSSCMVPLVPALTAAGMLNVVVTLIKLTGAVAQDSTTFILLNTMANAGFYFLPMLVAYTAARRFKASPLLALVCVGILIHPNFIALVDGGQPIDLFGLPVASTSYASQVFPAVLTVWFMSVVERFFDKHLPSMVKYFMQPLLVVFVTACASLVVLAPLGYYISQAIAAGFMFIQERAGWLSVAVLSLVLPFLVMTGTHKAISPIALALFTSLGYDSFFLVSFLGFNFSQGAAALAVAIRTKNPELKQEGYAAAVSGLLAGITEPALYGFSLKFKKPLYASMIASAAAGLFSGIMGVKLYTYAGPALVTMPIFISPDNPMNFWYAVIAALIATVGTLVLTWAFGWDENVEEADAKAQNA